MSASLHAAPTETTRERISALRARAAHHRAVASGYDGRRDHIAANRELDRAYAIERELRQISLAEDS
jgi:hypothetical protein